MSDPVKPAPPEFGGLVKQFVHASAIIKSVEVDLKDAIRTIQESNGVDFKVSRRQIPPFETSVIVTMPDGEKVIVYVVATYRFGAEKPTVTFKLHKLSPEATETPAS